ncbi:heme peroxidase [Mycena crocata]|nr:heme peroxidase [Mycena crocata]
MLGLALLVCAATANGYIWPSPQLDRLEALRFDQVGYNAGGISPLIQTCDRFPFSNAAPPKSGRADVADWIRTAYHDMATHNVEDGTGGLDASIRFAEEQARGENVGDGFNNSINAFIASANRYTSLADVIAIATIMAIENCGGPDIAFRGGRIDATEPNKPGVPEPSQDLDSHIASFARQGFTKEEMIGLVACGHTFGGVQHAAFPNTVPEMNDPNNTLSVQHFDSTFVHFDNNVATEYISGTTQNPLVVGLNETTNSDKRIFASDGNVTMRSFAESPEHFASTCGTLFARMLDTVPRGVQLSEVITALPVKPKNLNLFLNGTFVKFSGEVRLWNTTNANQTVRVLWDDHAGREHTALLSFAGLGTSIDKRHSAGWYSFKNALLNATDGVTNMRFTVNGKLEDQNGVGFAVQDNILFSETSCVLEQNEFGAPTKARMEVAVRNGLDPTRVFFEVEETDSFGRDFVVETDIAPPAASNATYSIWSVEVNDNLKRYGIGAEVAGRRLVMNGQELSMWTIPLCAK